MTIDDKITVLDMKIVAMKIEINSHYGMTLIQLLDAYEKYTNLKKY